MILEHIPNVLGAVFLSALLAVIMGTADSTLLVSAIMVEKDLLAPFMKKDKTDKQKLFMNKLITAICGVAVLGIMLYSTDMFELWVMSADITGATLAFPILFGFSKRGFGAKYACLGAMLFGFAGWLASYMKLVSIEAILFGGGLSLIAYVVMLLERKVKGKYDYEIAPKCRSSTGKDLRCAISECEAKLLLGKSSFAFSVY